MAQLPSRSFVTASARACAALLLALGIHAPAAAQFPFPLPPIPFPLPSLPAGGGAFSLPYFAPPMSAVPVDSESHRAILKQYGGPITDAHSLVVQGAMAAISAATRPVSPPGGFRATLLDSAEVNAFAVGDGNTYVTRQILGLMNSEEELIGVMGHEAGHAIARHSQFDGLIGNSQRMGTSLLAVVAPGLAEKADFATTLVTRVFDRAEEHQADVTGVKVLADLGLDPMGMYRAIEILDADTNLDSTIYGAPQPGVWSYWLRDHPVSSERLSLIELAAKMAPRAAPSVRTDRATFIRSLNGLLFDSSPRDGIVDGQIFRVPPIRLMAIAPPGFRLRNGGGVLVATGPRNARAALKFAGGEATSLVELFRAGWIDELGKDKALPDMKTALISGIEVGYASVRFAKDDGFVDVVLGVANWPLGGTMRVITIDPGGSSGEPLAKFMSSIAVMSPSAALESRVRRIKVIEPRASDTIASLSTQMAYQDLQEARFRALNGIPSSGALPKGRPLKLVVWSH